MKRVLMLTGDVNLMNVIDPEVPFARIADTLRRADVLFGNLECCFYEPPGHGGRAHGDWVGMLARLTFDDAELSEVAFSLVRHNDANETYACDLGQDKDAVEQITRRCDKHGTALAISGGEMIVWKA